MQATTTVLETNNGTATAGSGFLLAGFLLLEHDIFLCCVRIFACLQNSLLGLQGAAVRSRPQLHSIQ